MAGKQVCMYEAAHQAFPAGAMRALEAMTAAMRARIQLTDPRLYSGVEDP
jgi:hypothetical protein